MSNESQVLRVIAGTTTKRSTADVAIVNEAGAAIFTSTGLVLSGDTRLYTGAGAPVNYTNGTPPATGEGEAGIGSLYLDTTNGNAYINAGTKAQPAWKLVTRAV